MSSKRKSTLAFQGSGWFTLALLVAYVVYVPIHLATEAHCVPGTTHFHACDCEHHGGHDDDHHHSADEHDLNATGKQDTQLSLVLLVSDTEVMVPARTGTSMRLTGAPDYPPDRSPDRSFPSRAPPLA